MTNMKKLILISNCLMFFVAGCFGNSQKQAPQPREEAKVAAPVVEVYFEYPGYGEKWAGPKPFVMHVNAREVGTVQVSLLDPKWTEENKVSLSGRLPAQENQKPPLTSEQVRDELKNLEKEITDTKLEQHDCLYPVHVRLVSSQGVVTEYKACRGQKGWPVLVSQMVSRYLGYL